MSDTHCPHGFYKHEDQCLDTQCLLDEVRELTKELRAANAALKAGRSGREEELQRERDDAIEANRKNLLAQQKWYSRASRAEAALWEIESNLNTGLPSAALLVAREALEANDE